LEERKRQHCEEGLNIFRGRSPKGTVHLEEWTVSEAPFSPDIQERDTREREREREIRYSRTFEDDHRIYYPDASGFEIRTSEAVPMHLTQLENRECHEASISLDKIHLCSILRIDSERSKLEKSHCLSLDNRAWASLARALSLHDLFHRSRRGGII